MVYSSLALSVWSLLFPPFFFLYWLYCDDHGWMSCITECRPSMDASFSINCACMKRTLLRTYLFFDRIYCLIDAMIWNNRYDLLFLILYLSGFRSISNPGFHLIGILCSLDPYHLFRLTSDHLICQIAIKQVLMMMKRNICSNENAPLSSCTWTQIFVSLPGYQLFGTPVVLQSSGVICPSFLLFFFVSLLYKTKHNLSTIFQNIFILSEFSDFIAQIRCPSIASQRKKKAAAQA